MPTPLHSSFPPHFHAFPQLSPRKIPPLAVARLSLSSVLCLWFHQDIVIQLYLAQWYSPDNVYIILHRRFPCLFFFSFQLNSYELHTVRHSLLSNSPVVVMALSLLQPTRTESLSENNDSSHDTRRPIKFDVTIHLSNIYD